MADRGRYDSAMFWLAFGTAAAVIGLALMTIGVTRSSPGSMLLASAWFDGGLGLLVLGAALLLWALALFLGRRRETSPGEAIKPVDGPHADTMTEAVRGYYAERRRLFDLWDREQRAKSRKPKA